MASPSLVPAFQGAYTPCSFVIQVSVVMASSDGTFTATSSAVPTGFSVCNNMTHEVTWYVSGDLIDLQVDQSTQERFPFNTFTPCRDLFNAPLYLAGVKGRNSFIVNFHYSAS